jgi:rRNA-processing protein FCF1
MKNVILDTDFFLQSIRWKIHLHEEFQRILDASFVLCIFDKTLDELKGKKDSNFARVFAQQFQIIPTGKTASVDELILELSEKNPILVATQDKELKEKLKKRKIPVVTIRDKSHLELV